MSPRRGRSDRPGRPGFVLEVDRSTPPTLFMHGEGFSLEHLPVGSRVVYPPEALPLLRDPDGAIRQALLHIGSLASSLIGAHPGGRRRS